MSALLPSWSNSRQSWQERIGLLVLLGGAAVIFSQGSSLALGLQLVLWLVWAVALALVLRRGWLKLLGPVLLYEMITVGRRTRYFLLRTSYIVFLALVMAYVHAIWSLERPGRLPAQSLSAFAESFFYTFMSMQMLALVAVTPAYVAGSIADEKDRRTLEFLLATDLRSREIVLGKLLARLANVLLLVLAGLPILAFMQFFGGIDPDLLLAGFTAQAFSAFSMAGVGILFSVYSRRPRDAIVLTYLTLVAYPALGLGFYALTYGFQWTPYGVTLPLLGQVTLSDVLSFLNAGNPLYILIVLANQRLGGAALAGQVAEFNRDYLLFHGLVGLACITWAVLRLRPIALRESGRTQRLRQGQLFHRPAVGADSMLWKELFIETGWRLNWLGKTILALLVVGSFLPAGVVIWDYSTGSWSALDAQERLAVGMNIYVRSVGTIIACLTLLGVTVRGASSIGGERDRQTLDALLISPLSTTHILWTKWLGSVLSMRWSAVWLGLVWLLGVVTGGLSILAVPILIMAWLVYASVFALIGMWFSIVSKTTGRATLYSLLTAMYVGGGHWCVGSSCCFVPLMMFAQGPRNIQHMMGFLAGQTPPVVLAVLAFRRVELGPQGLFSPAVVSYGVFGLICWGVASGLLWNLARTRFERLTGRGDGVVAVYRPAALPPLEVLPLEATEPPAPT